MIFFVFCVLPFGFFCFFDNLMLSPNELLIKLKVKSVSLENDYELTNIGVKLKSN